MAILASNAVHQVWYAQVSQLMNHNRTCSFSAWQLRAIAVLIANVTWDAQILNLPESKRSLISRLDAHNTIDRLAEIYSSLVLFFLLTSILSVSYDTLGCARLSVSTSGRAVEKQKNLISILLFFYFR